MRISLILGLLTGVFIGILLGSQVATSQEEILPPEREGRNRFQIAGHSTYPPLLLDSETGASWILMSDSDGEERRWVWEPIEMGVLSENLSPSKGRDIVRLPEVPRGSQGRVISTTPRALSW